MYNTLNKTASAESHGCISQKDATTKSAEGNSPKNDPINSYRVGNEFPVDALPKWVQEHCKHLSVAENVDIAIPAVGFLGACSTAVGQGMNLHNSSGGSSSPANIWLAIVGEPSCGKRILTVPFLALEELLKEQSKEADELMMDLNAKRKSLEAKARYAEKSKNWSEIEKLHKEIGEIEKLSQTVRPMWMANDFTPEAMIQGFACEGRPRVVSVVASEGRPVMVNMLGRYGKTPNEDFFLCGWNRATDSRHRIRKNYCKTMDDGFVSGMHLSICIAVQTDMGAKFRQEPLSTSGFVQRLLYACVKSPDEIRVPTAAARRAKKMRLRKPDLAKWNDFVTGLFKASALKEEARVVDMSKNAECEWELFQDVVNGLRAKEESATLKSQIARWLECAGRVSLVLHAMEHGVEAPKFKLSRKTMRSACRIVLWFGRQMCLHQRSGNLGETKLERSICSYARKKGQQGFALYELTRAGVADQLTLEPVVRGLVPHRLVPVQTTGDQKMGRPPVPRWRLAECEAPSVPNSLS